MESPITERITRFQINRVPVGWAATLTVGLGVGNAVAGAIAGWTKVQPQWTKIGLGCGLALIPQVGKTIGSDTSNLLGAALIAGGINQAWAIQQRTENWVAKLFGRVEEVVGLEAGGGGGNPGGNGHVEAPQTINEWVKV